MKKLQELLSRLFTRIEAIRALSPDILSYVPSAESVLTDLTKVVEILKDPNGAISYHTAGFIGARAEETLALLEKYEYKFLRSYCVRDLIKARMGKLDPDLSAAHRINTKYYAWNNGRERGPIGELRTAYIELMSALKIAEDQSTRKRIQMTMAAEPPKRVERRRKERRGAGTQKGVNPAAPKHGGHGTSRDAERRRRRRDRRQANAA